ncbi:MAG TPA: amino acid aminotransferase [Rhabdochlamydiaceae bacterium]|nr:amino acid aminotransferase [Rhabdochlamydiaceae bacterium]
MVETSLFDKVSLAPPDAIFGLVKDFQADSRPNKVNLLVGFFKTETGATPFLLCVKEAEEILLRKEKNKEYLPIDGNPVCIEKIGALLFGEALWKKSKAHICGAQTVGGTGALRTLGDFFKREMADEIWISDPTWANHHNIFPQAGLKINKYPYYDRNSHQLLFQEMLDCLSKLQKGSIVLLHSNCHNPTGFDLSAAQWKQLSDLFLQKGLFPFFDVAYQGFGDGLEEDAFAVRYFLERGHELAVAYSCAKNFSLYGERVGALYLADGSTKNRDNIQSQIKSIIRANYSNPSIHGAAIVAEILSAPELTKKWHQDLKEMRERISKMREQFVTALSAKKIPYALEFMRRSKGLFCYTGLKKQHVDKLISQFGIYLPSDGRINVTGLNQSNLDYVVNAIAEVLAHG